MQEPKILHKSLQKLSINCSHNLTNFSHFKHQINNLTHHHQCAISILKCQYHHFQQIKTIMMNNASMNLVELELIRVEFGVKRCRFFRHLRLQKLHTFKIKNSTIDDKQLEELCKCQMPNLKILHILQEVSYQVISFICNANWTKLEEVHLKIKKHFSSALWRIGKAQWKNLIRLNICGNELSHQIKNIALFFDFPNLKQICLNDFITEQVLTKIDNAKQPLLEVLDIRNCPVSGIDVFNSRNNVGWQGLKQLYIGCQKIKKQEICLGLLNICIYSFPKLTKFSMNSSFLTKQAIKHFLKAEWNELKQLEIYDCDVNEESLKIFSKCYWTKLKHIKLSSLTSDPSIEYLPSANWPSLTVINLYQTNITTLGAMSFGKLQQHEMKIVCLDFDQREKPPNSIKGLFNMRF